MPRSQTGAYSLPAGSLVSDGTDDILASQHNTPLQDIATDLNVPRPVSVGGTGASTAAAARTNLGATALGSTLFTAADPVTARTAINAQTQDATLEALSALDPVLGFLVQTATDTFAKRSLVAGDGISIANPVGTAGNATVATIFATQAEGEGGTNTVAAMNALRTRQAVDARSGTAKVWQTVTRAADTNYQNTTGYPLDVLVKFLSGGAGTAFIDMGPNTGAYIERVATSLSAGFAATPFITVPVGWFYRIRLSGGVSIDLVSERSL
jgi:hypothetical protein